MAEIQAERGGRGTVSIGYREAPAQKDNALPAFELFKWRCAQPFWRVDFSDYAHNISLEARKGG